MSTLIKLIRELSSLTGEVRNTDYLAVDRQGASETVKVALKDIDVGAFDNSKTGYRTSCNFTGEDAQKLASLEVDDIMSDFSSQPIANKTVKAYIDNLGNELKQTIANLPIFVSESTDSVTFDEIQSPEGIYITNKFNYKDFFWYSTERFLIVLLKGGTILNPLLYFYIFGGGEEGIRTLKLKNDEYVLTTLYEEEINNSSINAPTSLAVKNYVEAAIEDAKKENKIYFINVQDLEDSIVKLYDLEEGLYFYEDADNILQFKYTTANEESFIGNWNESKGVSLSVVKNETDDTKRISFHSPVYNDTDGTVYLELNIEYYFGDTDGQIMPNSTIKIVEDLNSYPSIFSDDLNLPSASCVKKALNNKADAYRLISQGRVTSVTPGGIAGIRITKDIYNKSFELTNVKIIIKTILKDSIVAPFRIRTNNGSRYLNYTNKQWDKNTLFVAESEYNEYLGITKTNSVCSTSNTDSFQGTVNSDNYNFLSQFEGKIADIEIYFGNSMGEQTSYSLMPGTKYEVWGY